MNSAEIIASIHQIFKKYRVPPNLQEHMLRAAAVGNLICDQWKGPKINPEDIVAVLLIHDFGNIVKMDLGSEVGLKLIGEEAKRVRYWKRVKQEVIQKYGKDDYLVSEKIAEELEVSERLKSILKNKVFNNNEFSVKSDDYDIKIAAYADQRIGPFGVLSLQERFRELRERYASRENENVNNPKIELFIECAFEIEQQIFRNTTLTPKDINDNSIKPYVERF